MSPMAVAERQRSAPIATANTARFFQSRASALLRGGAGTGRVSFGDGFLRPVTAHRRNRSRRAVAVGGAADRSVPRRGAAHQWTYSRTDGPSYTDGIFVSRIANTDLTSTALRGLILTNLSEPTTNVGAEFTSRKRSDTSRIRSPRTYTLRPSTRSVDGVRQDVR
jgi:hypothetical protein